MTATPETRPEAPARMRRPAGRRLPSLVAAGLGLGSLCAPAFTLVSSNELVFVNVDHAPVGACSTLAYGFPGGTLDNMTFGGDISGLGMSSPAVPFHVLGDGGGGGGVVIALAGSTGLQALPFLASPASAGSNASYFPNGNVHRTLAPCTDQWGIDQTGLSFTHYSPAWFMADLDTATLADKKRFFLPATWLVFTVNNTNTTAEDLYFGLPATATQATFANGAYRGFLVGEAALAVQAGSCDLLSGASLTAVLDGMTKGFAFDLKVPAGQIRSLTVVVAYYRAAVVDTRISGSYYYTSLFGSVDSAIDSAFAGLADAQTRSQQLASAMVNAGLNPYRQFLASHALHSYMANTACLIDPSGNVYWRVTEGAFQFINTFDLTADHAFYESLMYPWALRNVLDSFSGAINGSGYTYDTALYDPSGTQVGKGFSFEHDMGTWPTSATNQTYGGTMGQEELQTWILSAGLYWSRTGDQAWLTENLALLQTCLNSLLARDNTNAAARNGITKNVNAGEITTFDDLDVSLEQPSYSGRLAVRNWACYLAFQAMFQQAGDAADAATCQNMAAVAAQTMAQTWTNYHGTLGYIPALLNDSSPAATIPMVEGLAFPLQMGLTNALDRVAGPYAPMLLALSNHLEAILVPGVCLNADTGAWDMTSAVFSGNDHNSWQSKMYLAQYVAENVLGLTGDHVNGTIDQIHASLQIGNAPWQEWSDQLDADGANVFWGGLHYPRGVTSALWWLNSSNNPGYPVPTSPPAACSGLRAVAGDGQVLLFWNGVALAAGYSLSRATASGGPYAPVTNGLTGASYTDTGLSDGTTYYYVVTATNAAGLGSASLPASATPVPSGGGTIAGAISDGNLTVSWPSNYVGWILQTNSVAVGNSAYWRDLPASRTNRQITIPVAGSTLPAEFFRLRHP